MFYYPTISSFLVEKTCPMSPLDHISELARMFSPENNLNNATGNNTAGEQTVKNRSDQQKDGIDLSPASFAENLRAAVDQLRTKHNLPDDEFFTALQTVTGTIDVLTATSNARELSAAQEASLTFLQDLVKASKIKRLGNEVLEQKEGISFIQAEELESKWEHSVKLAAEISQLVRPENETGLFYLDIDLLTAENLKFQSTLIRTAIQLLMNSLSILDVSYENNDDGLPTHQDLENMSIEELQAELKRIAEKLDETITKLKLAAQSEQQEVAQKATAPLPARKTWITALTGLLQRGGKTADVIPARPRAEKQKQTDLTGHTKTLATITRFIDFLVPT